MIAVVSLAAGCSQSSNGEKSSFSGAWGPEIQQMYDKAPNEMMRSILQDGKVTASELNDAEEAYSQCLSKYDTTLEVREDGGVGVVYPEGIDEKEAGRINSRCKVDKDVYGNVEYLHREMRINPENQDPRDLMYDCLKKHSLIDKSMSLAEYRVIVSDEDSDAKEFGKYVDRNNPEYDEDLSQIFWQCNDNPKGL